MPSQLAARYLSFALALLWGLSACTAQPDETAQSKGTAGPKQTNLSTLARTNLERESPCGILVSSTAGLPAVSDGYLQPGDRVLAWAYSQRPVSSEGGAVSTQPTNLLDHALELFRVETELSAVAPISLLIERDAKPMTIDLGRRPWRTSFEPVWQANLGRQLNQLFDQLNSTSQFSPGGFSPDGVLVSVDNLIRGASNDENPIHPKDQAWLWAKIARTLRDLPEGTTSAADTVPPRETTGDTTAEIAASAHRLAVKSVVDYPYLVGQLNLTAGIALHRERNFELSSALLQDGLGHFQGIPEARFAIARSHYFLGQNALFVGNVVGAEAEYAKCLAGLPETPSSLGRAACIDRRGQAASMRGDLAAARELFAQGLEIRRVLAPDSLEVASSLNGLGTVAARGGDLARAQNMFEQVLAIRQELSPGSAEVSAPLTNLGYVAARRGDLAQAEHYYLASLEVLEQAGETQLMRSYPLNNLANVSRNRGELARALDFGEQALAIRQNNAPGSRMVATSLIGVASTLQKRGELEAAMQKTQEALTIARAQARGSVLEANVLGLLGKLQADQERWRAAETTAHRVVEIYQSQAPNSSQAALAFTRLAQAKQAMGATKEALEFAQRADQLADAVAQGTFIQAETKNLLGKIHSSQKDRARALGFFQAAVWAIEQQGRRAGTDERGLDTFRSQHQKLYDDLLEAQLASGQTEAALETLERGRARAMVATLHSRDLLFHRELPPQLAAQYRGLTAEYERLRRLGERSASVEQALSTTRQQNELELRFQEVERNIAEVAPRYAALTRPEPLDYEELVATLHPGTLHLAYSVQPAQTRLFALDASGNLDVFRIKIARHELQREIEIFRTVLMSGASKLAQPHDTDQRAERLFDQLLSQVSDRIHRAERVTISSNGPLHLLPWSALRGSASKRSTLPRKQYLVEMVPILSIPSLSVQDVLRPARSTMAGRVVAFADPRQNTSQPASDTDREDTVRSNTPAPAHSAFDSLATPYLPWSRVEAEALQRSYPGRSEVIFGTDATESRAKNLPSQLAVLHFATHAIANDDHPLDSALLLTASRPGDQPTDEDGILHAWEIFEQVRVQADLVTLSGCNTGLGRVITGEGLVGLTRAFQYAGASSVISSLWSVSDRSTAELMSRLYRYLAEGEEIDTALQKAQLDLLRGEGDPKPGFLRNLFDHVRGGSGSSAPPSHHPYRWAGFQLYGPSH